MRDLYAEQLAPRFSPFQFVDTGENGISRILAWLLRPQGSHGQGGRFLELFAAQFDLHWDAGQCRGATSRVEVVTSHLSDDRRIDVLVTSICGRAIAIENKIWAMDQQQQVTDYLRHLDLSYGAGKACLIYLTPDGREPDESSISKLDCQTRQDAGALKLVSYSDLLPWLETCRNACRADRVARFIEEFMRHIQHRFSGVPDMTEQDSILEEMTRSAGSITASLSVGRAVETMKERLLDKLVSDLDALITGRGWQAARRSYKQQIRWSSIQIRYSSDAALAFEIEFCNDERSSLDFGIRAPNANAALTAEIREALRSFGRGNQNHVWPWYQSLKNNTVLPLPHDWHSSEEPWIEIAQGRMAEPIVKAAERFHDELTKGGVFTPSPTPAA
ncbi:PDDEXK-like family protein [Pseudoroseomonas ludipueritiae]|uniref:PD-(D/E)XK nuclease family protein n=1 Tax=Pseudoroseomonas ludipueritiae TaxID=198093 RepID=A0ABR7R361_9PROT|nr:PD-(D/E)XK nuclease family protein [Pseudoroseomonas ludipueritiae]MBC9176161.1 PD-(D/E)XK nuclease family protein [Pseudoroseomonas ludipueritiae]